MPRGKKSGIRYGQRTKQNAPNDEAMQIALSAHIKRKWKQMVKREWYLLFDENYHLMGFAPTVTKREHDMYIVRNPDLFWIDSKTVQPWICELDGAVHRNRYKKDKRRNEIYQSAGINLVILQLFEMPKRLTVEEYFDKEYMKIAHL